MAARRLGGTHIAVTAARSSFLSKHVVFPQRERKKVVTKCGYRVLNSLVLIILIILINNIVILFFEVSYDSTRNHRIVGDINVIVCHFDVSSFM